MLFQIVLVKRQSHFPKEQMIDFHKNPRVPAIYQGIPNCYKIVTFIQ